MPDAGDPKSTREHRQRAPQAARADPPRAHGWSTPPVISNSGSPDVPLSATRRPGVHHNPDRDRRPASDSSRRPVYRGLNRSLVGPTDDLLDLACSSRSLSRNAILEQGSERRGIDDLLAARGRTPEHRTRARSDASIEQRTIRPACDAPVAVVGHVPAYLDRVTNSVAEREPDPAPGRPTAPPTTSNSSNGNQRQRAARPGGKVNK